jgi:hypothetical protein
MRASDLRATKVKRSEAGVMRRGHKLRRNGRRASGERFYPAFRGEITLESFQSNRDCERLGNALTVRRSGRKRPSTSVSSRQLERGPATRAGADLPLRSPPFVRPWMRRAKKLWRVLKDHQHGLHARFSLADRSRRRFAWVRPSEERPRVSALRKDPRPTE